MKVEDTLLVLLQINYIVSDKFYILQVILKIMKSSYLTIDDSPSENLKEKIQFLLDKNVPAILFCQGSNLEKNKEAVAFAIKKGFIIG
ncbi:polysaccharide deacetylase family protein, partial [Nanoarchaeota archaeon]